MRHCIRWVNRHRHTVRSLVTDLLKAFLFLSSTSCSRFCLVQVLLVVSCTARLSKMSNSICTLERQECDIIQSLEKLVEEAKESAKMVGDRLAALEKEMQVIKGHKRLSRKWGKCRQK